MKHLFPVLLVACSTGKTTATGGSTSGSGATSTLATGAPVGTTTGVPGATTSTSTSTTSTTTLTPNQFCAQAAAGLAVIPPIPAPGVVGFCHYDTLTGNWVWFATGASVCLQHISHSMDMFATTICDD